MASNQILIDESDIIAHWKGAWQLYIIKNKF